MLEKLIIENCSSTLANLKTGEILNYRYDNFEEAKTKINLLNNNLLLKGVQIEILVEREKSCLLYVYRKNRLKYDLSCPVARRFLQQRGYPFNNIDGTIQLLKKRINKKILNNEFPHEIGLFLSYPAQDVIGFIENKGKNCKYCGYWKVYGEKKNAVLMFAKFDKCKQVYKEMCRQGAGINKLTVAS